MQSNWLFLVTSSKLMQRSLELKQKGRRKPLAGRTQVLESRLKKGWAVAPIKDKVTYGKRGSGGAETKAEVFPALKKQDGQSSRDRRVQRNENSPQAAQV